jgi:integrase
MTESHDKPSSTVYGLPMAKFWVIGREDRKRWIVKVSDGGKTRQMAVPPSLAHNWSAAGKRAVEKWAADELAKAAQPATQSFVEPNMTELADRFLAYAATNEKIEAATRSSYGTHLRNWFLPFKSKDGLEFKAAQAHDLTIARLREWIRYLCKQRAPQTVRNIVNSLSACLTTARAEEWTKCDRNPVQDDAVRAELPELERHDVEVLSHDAVQALITGRSGRATESATSVVVVHVPLAWRLRYALGALAGLEDGAIAGLKVGDIERDGDSMLLAIRRAVKIKGASGFASVGTTKNQYRGTEKAPRRVPVHPVAAELVDAWLSDGWEAWTGQGRGPRSDDWLLPRPDGETWRPKSAKQLRSHLVALGVDAPKGAQEFKQLRAWFATAIEAGGASEATRKRLMGHRGSSTAARHYTAEQRELDRKAIEAIRIGGEDVGNSIRIGHSDPYVRVPNQVPTSNAWHPDGDGTTANEAPPARIELATNGLGIRCAGAASTTSPKVHHQLSANVVRGNGLSIGNGRDFLPEGASRVPEFSSELDETNLALRGLVVVWGAMEAMVQ